MTGVIGWRESNCITPTQPEEKAVRHGSLLLRGEKKKKKNYVEFSIATVELLLTKANLFAAKNS